MDLMEPAVHGTENVLHTANKTPTVQRVVLTSLVVALYNHASDLEKGPRQGLEGRSVESWIDSAGQPP